MEQSIYELIQLVKQHAHDILLGLKISFKNKKNVLNYDTDRKSHRRNEV